MKYTKRSIKTFVSYSHDDDDLLDALQKHFAVLKRHHAVDLWTDGRLEPGTRWSEAIGRELEAADLILLLISASFLASDFCYEIEMQRALERHDEGTARVVPIILRPCDWTESRFAKLQALPTRGEAITAWDDADAAMTGVAKGLRRLLNTWIPTDKVVKPPGANTSPKIPIPPGLLTKSLLILDGSLSLRNLEPPTHKETLSKQPTSTLLPLTPASLI